MQLLRAGQATRAHRHTGSVVYQVAMGRGNTVINGHRYDWEQNDIFCVPSWTWHEHGNDDQSKYAFLFSFNDFPTINSLDLFTEEAYEVDCGHQSVIGTS